MRNVYLIFKREFGVLFSSPLAYVLFVLFLVISGIFFSAGFGTYVQYSTFIQMQSSMRQFGPAPQLPPFTDMVFGNFFRNTVVIFLFMLPLFTMRLFAEERRSGTEELLMTFPIRDIEIVVGKFMAALAAVMIMLGITLTYCLMTDYVTGPQSGFVDALLVLPKFIWFAIKVPFVWLFGDGNLATVLSGGEAGSGLFKSPHLDPGPIMSAYLGLLLTGAAFVALGVFASSITEHQIVAANIAFAILLIFWMIGWVEELTDISLIKTVVSSVSINTHLEPFMKGDPDFLNIAYFIGISCYFLFLTWVVLFWTRLGRGFISVGKKSKLNVLWLIAALGIIATINIRVIQGEWTAYSTVGTLLTLGALAAWFVLNIEWLASLVVSHGFLYTMMLGALAIFGLIVLCAGLFIVDGALDIAQRKSNSFQRHIDMTRIQKYSLAEQSKKILESLNEPVTFVYIEDPNRPMELQQAQEIFELYERGRSDMVKLDYVDAEKNPIRVQDFGSTVACGDVYVESGSGENFKRQKVEQLEENDITNGILKVVNLTSPKIYVTTGHGEPNIEESQKTDGLGIFSDQLKKEVYDIESLNLFAITEIPKDAAAVLIVDPKTPFTEDELGLFTQYMDRGGNLLVFLEPQMDPSMDSFLKFLDTYGVEADNDLIVDPSLQNRLMGTYARLSTNNFGTHEITEGLERMSGLFDFARSLRLKDELPNEATGTELVKSMAESSAWGETDLDAVARNESIGFDAGIDNEGPLTVAVVLSWEPEAAGAEIGSTTDENTGIELNEQTPASRLVVFGDSDMIKNANFTYNRNLLLNTMAWMAQRQELVSIRPRTEFGQPIMVTDMESRVIWALGVMDLPVLVMLIGIAVLVRRRVRG